jgi:hypothetical protein
MLFGPSEVVTLADVGSMVRYIAIVPWDVPTTSRSIATTVTTYCSTFTRADDRWQSPIAASSRRGGAGTNGKPQAPEPHTEVTAGCRHDLLAFRVGFSNPSSADSRPRVRGCVASAPTVPRDMTGAIQ